MNLAGRVFGALTVVALGAPYRPSKGQSQRQWVCACLCGKTTVVRTGHLTSGATKSCGCMRTSGSHGQSRTTLYRLWSSMKQRCLNPNAPEYRSYGGRGIEVCPAWRESFVQFRHDVGPRPSPSHELDRIENDGHYVPGNVRWATRAEQCANTRKTIRIEVSPGIWMARDQAARAFGVSPSTLRYRLERGIPVAEALSQSRFKPGRKPK